MNPLGKREARFHVKRVVSGLFDVENSLRELYEGRGWEALGYASWDDMCAEEFAALREISAPQRRQIVTTLSEAGISQRAQAKALGVHRRTIDRDQADVAHNAPRGDDEPISGVVIGLDGKRYPQPEREPEPFIPPPPETVAVRVVFTVDEYAMVRAMAETRGLSIPDFVHQKALTRFVNLPSG